MNLFLNQTHYLENNNTIYREIYLIILVICKNISINFQTLRVEINFCFFNFIWILFNS